MRGDAIFLEEFFKDLEETDKNQKVQSMLPMYLPTEFNGLVLFVGPSFTLPLPLRPRCATVCPHCASIAGGGTNTLGVHFPILRFLNGQAAASVQDDGSDSDVLESDADEEPSGGVRARRRGVHHGRQFCLCVHP